MSDDLSPTQVQDAEGAQRARERSLQNRRPPTQVPGYDLLRCLGDGAYGEVWVAAEQNNPGHRVAIKFYTRRGGDWALLAREVEKLNFLATDRYVVQLRGDIGWNAEPPYYIMEFMEKGSLAERLEQGPLPVAEAIALFREVATGVVNAHNRGVLHCDLKPANVLLGTDGKPRLADFGQSRLTNEQTPALGTLFYMAPEQADLKATPDARWDVYALGALFYCLLTGQPPYRDTVGVKTLQEPGPLEEKLARYRQLLRDAPRPRQHRRVPGIDRALVDIIDHCLAVNPGRRFPNVQAVLNALDARALRRARRPLLVMGVVGPVLLLLLMGLLMRSELLTAVENTTGALVEAARAGDEFAAQAAAEKVASKIDRRWRTLEGEAASPDFQALLKAARGAKRGMPAQEALQRELESMQRSHPEVSADSWFVFDDLGTLLAYSPRRKEVDAKYIGIPNPYGNYFNGLEKDVDRKAPPPPPLSHVYRSNVYESRLTQTRKVAFSVPVWDGRPMTPEQPRIGVLSMTVEVGGFVELQPEEGLSRDFVAVLVDRRADATGHRGAILEHPRLAELRRTKEPEKNLLFYVDPEVLDKGSWNPNYTDPVGTVHADYRGRWLAASNPVLIDGRPEVRDTGWVVIVQERYGNAIGPVLTLESDILTQSMWAMGTAVTLVTALWCFVLFILNDSPRSRFLNVLKRRAGLVPESVSLPRASGVRTRSYAPPRDPAADRPTERQT